MLSAPEADLVRRDGALPGLATVLDPEALIAALASALPTADVRAASIRYVRYKPHTNCLVAYQLDLDGPESRPVAVHAKVHRLDAFEKLGKAHQRAHVPGRLGPGRVVLEDRGLVVWVFPNDLRLRTVRRLAEGNARARLLRRLFPDRRELWAGTLETLRYKPERRYVARLETAGEAQAVLKVHAAPRYQRAARSAAAFCSRAPLRVPRMLGRSDAQGIVALEWLPGRLVDAALADEALARDAVTAVGAALAELHSQHDAPVPATRPGTDVAALLALAADLGFLCPDLARPARELAARLAARLARTGAELRPIHGDFYAEQVLLSDAAVAIFDLDQATLGDPAADLGTFAAHLERDALDGGPLAKRVPTLRTALLEGYRAATGHPPPPGVDLRTAVGLFRLAPEPFRAREPDWPQRIAAILARAAAAV